MTTFTNSKMRGVAILTGGVLAASAIFQTAPAQADEKKEKTYKTGAAALGVLGAYFILKGKTVPAAAAGAGAYYAYKKSKDVKNDDRYSDNYDPNDRYSNGSYSNGGDTYPDGSWRTSSSDTGTNRTNNRYPDYDYNGIAPAKNNTSSAVVLK